MATALAATDSNAKTGRDPELRSHVIVLFGATGDLARRKLLPGLFHLSQAGLLPDGYRVVGASVEELSDDAFREFALEAVEEFGRLKPSASEGWGVFIERVSYIGGGFGPGKTDALAEAVAASADELGDGAARLFFMAVPPVAFAPIAEGLGSSGLAEDARVIMEKPFGTDHASARALNATVHSVLDEEQVFRIDHFLGKETVQNILALRFANGMFEPIWNRNHIDHVQIDVPETLGVGQRAGFYEATGAFRDMVITHLLQVLGFVAMEPPTSLDPKALRVEKNKVFEAMRPLDPSRVVRGRYDGYLSEPGVSRRSQTETFVALEVEVDNWRWAGVPFFLRTGKSMAENRQSIALAFREPPLRMFTLARGQHAAQRPNELMIEFRDPGSISARFLAKEPGPAMDLREAAMTFQYDEESFGAGQLEAYERLLHDAMLGDQTLFTDAAGIERLWELSTPLLQHPPRLHPYEPGSWGPAAARKLVAPRNWCLPEED